MTIWRLALAYAPALIGLCLLLTLFSAALYRASRAHCPWRAALGSRALSWGLALVGLGLLGALLALRQPGALLLSLAVGLSGGALGLVASRPTAAVSTAPALATPPDDEQQPGAGPLSHLPWLWAEGALLLLAAPILMFPTLRPSLAAAAALTLVLSWLLLALVGDLTSAGSRLWPATPYDLALLLLLGMAALAIFRSTTPLLTLPKACSLLLGVAAYRLALRVAQRHGRAALPWIAAVLCIAALAMAALGLLGGLRSTRIPAIAIWLARLPRLFQAVPETQGGRVSLNQLGGALLLAWPVALALATAPRRQGATLALRFLAIVSSLALAATLLLTQSRGAWLGGSCALVCLLLLRLRHSRWLALTLAIVASLAWLLRGNDALQPLLVQLLADPRGLPSPVGALNLHGRLAIWTQTLYDIRRSPWIGHGLGTFRLADSALHTAAVFDIGLPHAHNVLLQVAYDLGLPGLVAYGSLLALAVWQSVWLWRHAQDLSRMVAVGVLASLTAFHIYGITDTVALGAKPGLLWWLLLALIAAAYHMRAPADR